MGANIRYNIHSKFQYRGQLFDHDHDRNLYRNSPNRIEGFQSDFQFLAVLWPMSVHLGVTKFLQSSQVAFFFGPCLALVNCTSDAPSTGPWQVALPAGCPKIPWFIVIFHDFSFFSPLGPLWVRWMLDDAGTSRTISSQQNDGKTQENHLENGQVENCQVSVGCDQSIHK